MKKREVYDVIIVGAGLSGLRLAENLNNSKLKVLLIEKGDSITKLTKKYFASFFPEVIKLKLEKFVIRTCDWGFYSTEKKYFRKLSKNYCSCVLRMSDWAESRKIKCEVKTNVEIINLKRGPSGILLIDKNKNEYFGKIIADCSGVSQTISSLLGIKKSKCDFLNYYYILENPSIKNDKEFFYFQDSFLTNCGGWFHMLEKNRCLFGCAEFTVKDHLNKDELKKRLDAYRKTFYPLNKYLKNAHIIGADCRVGPTTTLHSSIVEDNYLGLGDAAGSGTPFIGDGLRNSIYMADSAY